MFAKQIDCHVWQTDDGTRTAALDKMIRAKDASPRALKTAVAAVSVGIVGGEAALDLNYAKDSRAESLHPR